MGPGFIRLLRASAGGAHRLRIAAWALLAVLALVPSPAAAQAVNGDTATGRTQVAVLTPGSIAKLYDMDFGKIAQSNTPGTVVLTPSATASCTVTGTLIRTGACKAAAFSIYGKRNWKARLKDVNGGAVTLNGPAGATMTMTNITVGVQGMSASPGGPPGWNLGSYNIDTNTGIASFWLGGTLLVGAAQTPGVYTGLVLVQVQFN